MSKLIFKKTLFLLMSIVMIVALSIVLNNLQNSKNQTANSQIENGFQIISIFAKNGFSPSKIEAKANTPSVIRFKTENTYDCTAAIHIPSLNYSKFLPASGVFDIQLLPQKPGTVIMGSCSMGMYGFTINFV